MSELEVEMSVIEVNEVHVTEEYISVVKDNIEVSDNQDPI
jgi:hypothetical protein